MSEYLCPFCKNGTTEIKETTSLASVVLRKRRCLVCGKSHRTSERAEMVDGALQLMLNAAQELIQQERMKNHADSNGN